MNIAGQHGVIPGEVAGGEVFVHGIPVLDGVRLNNHRILAHLRRMPLSLCHSKCCMLYTVLIYCVHECLGEALQYGRA